MRRCPKCGTAKERDTLAGTKFWCGTVCHDGRTTANGVACQEIRRLHYGIALAGRLMEQAEAPSEGPASWAEAKDDWGRRFSEEVAADHGSE